MLSATISNSDDVLNYMKKNLKTPCELIKYNIRPIPLQKTLFKKNIKINKKGAILQKDDLECSTLSLYENFNDPTIRDIKKFIQISKIKHDIPENREKQFHIGQKIINDMNLNTKKLLEKDQEKKIIDCSNIESPENVLTLIQSLIANNMGPIIIFVKSSVDCVNLSKHILRLLESYEISDHDVKKAQKYMDQLEKKQKVKEDRIKSGKIKKKELEEEQNEEVTKMEEEKCKSFINTHLYKWKFKSDNKKKISKNEWINELVSYGIGIHCKSVRSYTRNTIFNMFNNKNIEILISDDSLSFGVNLPVRTVVIVGEIDMINYTHMSGRAGRRGHDPQGYVIPLMNKENIRLLYNSKNLIHHLEINDNINIIDIMYISKYYKNNYSKKIFSNIQKYSNYVNILEWIYSHDCINDDFINIIINNKNHLLFNLYIILKLDVLNAHVKNKNSDLDILKLLAMIINAIPSDKAIKIESDKLNISIELFNKNSPEEFKFNYKINDYIVDFYSNGKIKLKDQIGSFQRTLFNITKYLKLVLDKDDLVLEKIVKIDQMMWNKCQSNNIKV